MSKTEVIFKLDRNTIVESAFFKALEEFLKLFPEKDKSWVDRSIMRIYDVIFVGYHKKSKQFKVYRNEKIDKYESKFTYYRVYMHSHKTGWCSCFYGKYGQERAIQLCSHFGACVLFDLYVQNLAKVKK